MNIETIYIDPNNFIPYYDHITEIEQEFSDQYIEKFSLTRHDLLEVPVVALYPKTLQNLIIDITREYNIFLLDYVGDELDLFNDFNESLNIKNKSKSEEDLS